MTADGRLFDSVAGQYAARRPAYPHGAVRWIVGSTPRRIADVGAGTGLLTGQLMQAGHHVIAIEPSPEMGAQLVASVPAAQLRPGTAEDLPLGPGEVDAVVAGSAFHWFDAERAVAEAARVLPVGGTLGLIRNIPDERCLGGRARRAHRILAAPAGSRRRPGAASRFHRGRRNDVPPSPAHDRPAAAGADDDLQLLPDP